MTFNLRGPVATLTGAIALLIGLVFLIIAIVQFNTDRRFAREARATPGTLLMKVIRVSTSGTGTDRTKTNHYEATYRFTVDGTTIEGRDELTRAAWESLTEGSPVEVRYLPTDPTSSRLAAGRRWSLAIVFGPVALLLTVIGAWLVVRGRRDAALESRLRQHGVRTTGTVTELRGLALTINEEQQWRVSYEFQDFQGHRHANTIDMPEEEAREWKVGDIGQVRYDSSKPTDAVWLGREAAT